MPSSFASGMGPVGWRPAPGSAPGGVSPCAASRPPLLRDPRVLRETLFDLVEDAAGVVVQRLADEEVHLLQLGEQILRQRRPRRAPATRCGPGRGTRRRRGRGRSRRRRRAAENLRGGSGARVEGEGLLRHLGGIGLRLGGELCGQGGELGGRLPFASELNEHRRQSFAHPAMLRVDGEHAAQMVGRPLAEAVLHEHVCLGQDALNVARRRARRNQSRKPHRRPSSPTDRGPESLTPKGNRGAPSPSGGVRSSGTGSGGGVTRDRPTPATAKPQLAASSRVSPSVGSSARAARMQASRSWGRPAAS